jgi:hypothetical protein
MRKSANPQLREISGKLVAELGTGLAKPFQETVT